MDQSQWVIVHAVVEQLPVVVIEQCHQNLETRGNTTAVDLSILKYRRDC